VFLLASQRLNVAPSEAIVIEDANAGIDAAKAGGFLACGIGHARYYLNADIKITHLRELAPHLY
jgi:beta-phosphoglucomutase-like phosphatase (HAD superfamily)